MLLNTFLAYITKVCHSMPHSQSQNNLLETRAAENCKIHILICFSSHSSRLLNSNIITRGPRPSHFTPLLTAFIPFKRNDNIITVIAIRELGRCRSNGKVGLIVNENGIYVYIYILFVCIIQ